MAGRWYSPTLGRFISADSIVPNPTNPQSLNRYTYVFNSPLGLIDPSGHTPTDGCETEGCLTDKDDWGENFISYLEENTDFNDPNDNPTGQMLYRLYEGTLPLGLEDGASINEIVSQTIVDAVHNINQSMNGWYPLANPGEVLVMGMLFSAAAESESGDHLGSGDSRGGGIGVKFGSNNWSKATYNSAEESMVDHFYRHPGPWQTPEEYTETAVSFYQDFWDMGKPHSLRGGGVGIKITTNEYFGIYTNNGRIVTFGTR